MRHRTVGGLGPDPTRGTIHQERAGEPVLVHRHDPWQERGEDSGQTGEVKTPAVENEKDRGIDTWAVDKLWMNCLM